MKRCSTSLIIRKMQIKIAMTYITPIRMALMKDKRWPGAVTQVCNPSTLGGRGGWIAWTQEVEVSVSPDHAIALQPGQQSETLSQKKKKVKDIAELQMHIAKWKGQSEKVAYYMIPATIWQNCGDGEKDQWLPGVGRVWGKVNRWATEDV